MISGRVKSIIDSTLSDRWRPQIRDDSGEDLEDLMRVDPTRLLDSEYAKSLVKDAGDYLNGKFAGSLPANMMGVDHWHQLSRGTQVFLSAIIRTYDSVVDHLITWSRKKGYETCTLYDDPHEEFFETLTDQAFYIAVCSWVAHQFQKMGIIDGESAKMFIKRVAQ